MPEMGAEWDSLHHARMPPAFHLTRSGSRVAQGKSAWRVNYNVLQNDEYEIALGRLKRPSEYFSIVFHGGNLFPRGDRG